MQPTSILALVAWGLLGTVIVGVILPVGTLVKDAVPPAPARFTSLPIGDRGFQPHICACNNSWALATDERDLSNQFFSQSVDVPDPRGLSSLAVFWGQFMDHDIVLSQTNSSGQAFTIPMTPFAANLTLRRNNVRIATNGQCREPVNVNSPEIDASTVYGDYLTDPALIERLRSYNGTGCQLVTSPGDLLPMSPVHPNEFDAGDVRSTEHSILTALHTLWMREHNRLCGTVLRERPYWSQEQAFWKARQIVIAKIQHITYTQWLPAMLGTQFSLLDTAQPKRADTRISVEFSTAGFRFGHTMVPSTIGPYTLPSIFFNASMILNDGIEPFLFHSRNTPAQRCDSMVIDGLRNFLFAAGPMEIGEDLVVRNLFRSRDNGLANYATLAQCYHAPIQNMLYDEYDAMIGLFAEPLYPGSSLPRTLATIVAEQFKRLRLYDPNFYTKMESAIGPVFYQEVLQTSLANVIAQNTNLENFTNTNVFFL